MHPEKSLRIGRAQADYYAASMLKHTSVFIFLRQLTTRLCLQLLLLSASSAAVDRYLLSAGPTAANPP